jgi:hypothetical protein
MTNDELKQRIHEYLKLRGEQGAMLDDLMEQQDIQSAGRQAVDGALEALKAEHKIAGFDPIYGYRQT